MKHFQAFICLVPAASRSLLKVGPRGTHLVSLLRLVALTLLVALPANHALGTFHLWNIREIYSDASGRLQFIEMFTTASDQNFVGGQQIRVSNVQRTVTHEFIVPSHLPGNTQNRALLFGTAGLQAAGGPAPDFVIPDRFLFYDSSGGNISFFGANSGYYTGLPIEGTLSRTWGGGNEMNTPRNYAGSIGFVLVSFAPYPNAVLASHPIAYWRFDDIRPVATNLGNLGPEANGTYSGDARPTSTAPRPPQFVGFEAGNTALELDGAGDFVGTAIGLLNSRPSFTISGWIRRAANQHNRTGLWGQNDKVEVGYVDNNTLQAWTDGPLNVTPNPFPNGQWGHLAITSDGTKISIYTNGLLAASRLFVEPPNNDFPFNIGGGGVFDATTNFFNGQIDEVAVFPWALAPEVICNHYTAAVGTASGFPPCSQSQCVSMDPMDTNSLHCLSAIPSVLSLTNLVVRFSKCVDLGTALDGLNYDIPGLTVDKAVRNPDGMSVTLTLQAPMTPGNVYPVTINNLMDLAGMPPSPNPCTLNFQAPVLSLGFALQSLYLGVGGVGIGDLTGSPGYPWRPHSTNYIGSLEGPTDALDNYGTRIEGYLVPPVSGNYNFFISSDDAGEFWLGNDSNPANIQRICFEPQWNNSRDWHGTERRNAAAPENKSSTLFPGGIPLVGGQYYYFLLLSKEGGVHDNCAVAWQIPGGPPPANGAPPISGAYMAALADPAGASLTITRQPADQTAVVTPTAQPVTFSVAVSASRQPVFYQWDRYDGMNWTPIPGANGSDHTFLPACTDNGIRFRARVSIPGASATSAFATLAVPYLVTTLNDGGAGSLRDAIACGSSGLIQFSPAVQTLRLTNGELFINKPLLIVGPGPARLSISGNNNSRVFNIGPQGNVDIHGLTITKGLAKGTDGNRPRTNGSPASGGGIHNQGTLRLFDCMIVTNRAQGGAGGYGEAGGIDIIPGHGAIARGGGIYNLGSLTLTRCTLLGNIAQGGRGGDAGFNELASRADGGFGASGEGGGIWNWNEAARVRLENCTFSENMAAGGDGGQPFGTGTQGDGGAGSGGALSGAFELESCTVIRNSANGGSGMSSVARAGGAGGVFPQVLTPQASIARNSIIALNTVSGQFITAPDVANPSTSVAWVSLGWNLIGITNGSRGWTANDFLGNSATPLNPQLGPCQDNGGLVWTMCPPAGSPVRDKGSTLISTDARGGRRAVDFPSLANAPGGNGADIGALEVDSLLRIASFNKLGAVGSARFKSDPGNNYVLQQTSVVTNRTWTNVVGTGRMGTGGVMDVSDSAASVAHRFYRVQSEALPPLPEPIASGPGSALQLDGMDDYAFIPDSPALRLGNQFTIEFWFKPASLAQGLHYLLARSSPDTSKQGAVIFGYSAPNQVEFYGLGYSGANPRTGSALTLPDTNWHHLAYSYDGAIWSGYLDGTQVFSVARVFSLSTAPNDWLLGTAFTSDPARVAGVFDEVRLWNLRRSTAQIQEARGRRLLGNESGLVGYWRFDEGAGATAADATGNAAHTALLRNGPAWIPSTLIPFAPNAATLPATGITGPSATLLGAAQANGAATTGYFEWGPTPGFGNVTPVTSLGSGTTSAPWNRVLTGLTPGTNYYYRAVATNAHGASFGEVLSFR